MENLYPRYTCNIEYQGPVSNTPACHSDYGLKSQPGDLIS
jgi:hypothetical protein